MKAFIYTVVFAVLVWIAFRYYPVNHEDYHVDPAEPDPQRSEVRLIGLEAPRYPTTAEEVLASFAEIATRDGNVWLVAGDLDEGMMTFVARSNIIGFRDYITVKAVDEVDAAKLAILARPRINGYDWGVNAGRLDRWLQELEHTLGRG